MTHSENIPVGSGDPSVDVSRTISAESAVRSRPDAGAALRRLQGVCERFGRLEERPCGTAEELLHRTAVALHSFAPAIVACEDAGMTRDMLLPHIAAVLMLLARSPLVNRLQNWPRGYAGDFETVEWLCDAVNRTEGSGLAWAVEQCALQSPVAQQHRNKVALQARTILTTVLANPGAHVASIGCGGCRDLSAIQDHVPDGYGAFVLVDSDKDALDFAQSRLRRLRDRSRFMHGRVPRALEKLPAGRFDLVVAGGLFDYLPDRWAIATLQGVHRRLAGDGRVFFSNMANGNLFRPWIEYLGDWRLIERREDDIRRLLQQSGFNPRAARIYRDTTQLAFLVEAKK
jgi:SAM-dependent methyltransferase